MKYCSAFFNCKSMNMMLNEKNNTKIKYCKEQHEFNYFKIRTFLDQVVYLGDDCKIFVYK